MILDNLKNTSIYCPLGQRFAAALTFYFPLSIAQDGSIESSGDPVLVRVGLLHTLLNGISCRLWPTGAFTNHITE